VDPILNVALFVCHTGWIVFNCVGWLWERTRPWQLATVTLTAASWFVLGLRYGWGYCPMTDWHWAIRARLEYTNDPPSYVQLLLREVAGIDIDVATANALAVIVLATSAALGMGATVRARRRASRHV